MCTEYLEEQVTPYRQTDIQEVAGLAEPHYVYKF